MKQQRAREILQALVNGIDPFTKEELSEGTVLEKADVVRALLVGVIAIDQDVARESRRRQLPRNIGRPWSQDESDDMVKAFQSGVTVSELAARHGRTIRGIESRLEKLGVITTEQRITTNRFGTTPDVPSVD